MINYDKLLKGFYNPKEYIRPAISRPYYDGKEKRIIATNGFILATINDDDAENSFNHADIDDNHFIYPDIDKIIPDDDDKNYISITFDIKLLFTCISLFKSLKVKDSFVKLSFPIDGSKRPLKMQADKTTVLIMPRNI